MMDHAERLAWIRTVIAVHGGWNRRSRTVLHAWARDQLLDESLLVQLVEEAFRQPGPSSRVPAPSPRPAASQPARHAPRRWWLTVISVVGLALSLALVRLLVERLPSVPAVPTRQEKPPATAEPVAADPSRTLPPPPVSFPTPPTLGAAAQPVVAPSAAALEARPAGALTAEAIERWRLTHAQDMLAWPAMSGSQRARVVASLAEWIAQSPSVDDVARLQAAMASDAALPSNARDAMLASAFDAMLQARARADERLTPGAAAKLGGTRVPSGDDSSVLQAWALQQVPVLEKSLAQTDARDRWVGWLQAVAAIERADARLECALNAIDAVVRGKARLDGQGLAADVLGSLLAAVPSDPRQSGFDATRRACTAWLADPRITSARLWALGGIWRSGGHAPDAWLLPGERDSEQARAALVKRWNAIDTTRAVAVWQPLQDRVRALESMKPATATAEVLALADWVRLIRQATALLQQKDPERVQSITDAERPIVARPSTQDQAWSARLGDARPERRMESLQALRANAPDALGERDAEALAQRAFSAPGKDERALAQAIIRENLLASPVMLRAMALEAVRADDPRYAADLVEAATGSMLVGDEPSSVRARSIAGLLATMPPRAARLEVDGAIRRLTAETIAWASEAGITQLRSDAGHDSWCLVHRMRDALQGQAIPDAVQPLMRDIDARIRRLHRVAWRGPRGFAAATAVLCDLQAVTLASKHLQLASTLRLMADEAALRRSRTGSALEQSSLSLQTIVCMQLACAGAPVGALPVAAAASAPDDAGARRRLVEADALLAQKEVDVPRVQVVLEEALQDDPSVVGSVDLARARLSTSGARSQWLEAAQVAAAGAMLPAPDTMADGLALASLLAQRGQTDRLGAQRGNESSARALESFASMQGLPSAEVLKRLRSADAAEREDMRERMEAAVMQWLDPEGASWFSAIVAGMDARVPEPPIPGGRLVR